MANLLPTLVACTKLNAQSINIASLISPVKYDGVTPYETRFCAARTADKRVNQFRTDIHQGCGPTCVNICARRIVH